MQDVFALLEYFRTRQGVYIPGEESREASDKDYVCSGEQRFVTTIHPLKF